MGTMDIRALLDDLESRIDEADEERLLAEWRAFLFGKSPSPIFTPRRTPRPSAVEWPKININDAIADFDAMAKQQFAACSETLKAGSGALLTVRSNYGTGILPSVFGAELFVMDRALNTLPTTRALAGGKAAVASCVAKGVPNLRIGLGGQVFDMGRLFIELLKPYPKLRKYVFVIHPDVQGPMDVCELLWGSGIFVELVDEPDLVKQFLELITETYGRFMEEWMTLFPRRCDWSAHWGLMQRGHVMLRDDSAMNLSPAMFDEFIRPYDQKVLDRFGGGVIHFCGRGDHFIASMTAERGMYAIAMSQPELNDMEVIYESTVDKGVKLLGFPRWAAEAALKRGRDLRGHVHCP